MELKVKSRSPCNFPSYYSESFNLSGFSIKVCNNTCCEGVVCTTATTTGIDQIWPVSIQIDTTPIFLYLPHHHPTSFSSFSANAIYLLSLSHVAICYVYILAPQLPSNYKRRLRSLKVIKTGEILTLFECIIREKKWSADVIISWCVYTGSIWIMLLQTECSQNKSLWKPLVCLCLSVLLL